MKKHKYERHIYFDTETVWQKSNPIEPTVINGKKYKRVNTIVYGIAWIWADFFWRLDLINNIELPLQFNPNKCQIHIHFGKGVVKKFIQYLDEKSKKYDLVVYVHNANFDIPFLSEARDEVFNKDEIYIQEKRAKNTCVVCKWTISRKGQAKQYIEFRDTYLFERMSLRRCIRYFLDEHGNYMNKKDIEYEKFDMEFNDVGDILGYYTYQAKKIGRDNKNNIHTLYDRIWVDWNTVRDKEYEYLISDIKGLPLLDISQIRLKKTAYKVVQEYCKFPEVSDREYKLLLRTSTKGSFGKMLCSIIQRNNYANNELIKEWANKHKDNYFNALLKHNYEKENNEYDLDVRSMFGGFTSIGKEDWWDAKPNEYGYVIDVNSLYPYIMCGNLPVGEVLHEKPEGVENVDYLKQYVFKPKYRPMKDNEHWLTGNLPIWKKQYPFRTNVVGNSFFKRYDHLDCNEVDDEFTIWSSYYDDVIKEMCEVDFNFIRYRYQKIEKPLVDFMQAMQIIKQENSHRIEGSGSVEEMKYNAAKILSNAMYGKSMEKRHEDTEYFHNDLRIYMTEEEYKKTGEEIYEQPYFTGNTGSFVCSMARRTIILAMKKIIDIGGKVFYCDTDSIMFTLNGNELPDEIAIDSKKLGMFKVERIFNTFRSMGKCKKYHVSLRNINLKDDEVIPWIKNNHPYWVWKHLENKPLESWKELIKNKVSASGFNKPLISSLPYEVIDELYDPNKNVLFVRSRNNAKEDKLTKVLAIEKVSSSFNAVCRSLNSLGEREKKGFKDYTGVLYPWVEDGNIKWIYKNIDELPILEIDKHG